jgi:hypothetical protein
VSSAGKNGEQSDGAVVFFVPGDESKSVHSPASTPRVSDNPIISEIPIAPIADDDLKEPNLNPIEEERRINFTIACVSRLLEHFVS